MVLLTVRNTTIYVKIEDNMNSEARARIIFLPLAAFEADDEAILNSESLFEQVLGKPSDWRPERLDDYLLLSELRIGVDAIRKVNDFASLRAGGERKLLAMVALAITPEAQNALLKIVEDLHALNVIIVVPQTARLLPTLMSRCQIERPRMETEGGEAIQKWAEEMLKAALPTRQKKAEVLIKKAENHVIKSHMIALVDAARREGRPAGTMTRALQLLSYAEQTGASHKILLDALCLII